MKNNMVYVAIDADDVGAKVGETVANDDTEGYSTISKSINDGMGIISAWAKSVGGKTIAGGSDELVICIPEESYADLENVILDAEAQSGFNLSAGVGQKLSEAAKALVFAKMNGKDQIVEYGDEVEDYLTHDNSGKEDEDFEADITTPADEMVDEHEKLVDVLESPSHEDDLEEAKEQEKELEEYKDAEENGEDRFISEDEENDKERAEETDRSETELENEWINSDDEDNFEEEPINEDEEDLNNLNEDEISDEDLLVDEDQEIDSKEDLDRDGRPDITEEHKEIDPDTDDLDENGEITHEEAVAADNIKDAEMYDNSSDIDESAIRDEEDTLERDLQDQIESKAEESVDEDTMRQVIFENLQSFRNNKEHLTQIRQENPELYQSMIAILRSMIEMAKKLGYEPKESEQQQDMEIAEESQEDVYKSEHFIKNFLNIAKSYKKLIIKMEKKGKKVEKPLEKSKLAAKQTTKHITRKRYPEYAQNHKNR